MQAFHESIRNMVAFLNAIALEKYAELQSPQATISNRCFLLFREEKGQETILKIKRHFLF